MKKALNTSEAITTATMGGGNNSLTIKIILLALIARNHCFTYIFWMRLAKARKPISLIARSKLRRLQKNTESKSRTPRRSATASTSDMASASSSTVARKSATMSIYPNFFQSGATKARPPQSATTYISVRTSASLKT